MRVFVHVLRDIFKEETVEYVLALIDEMLTGNLKELGLFVSLCNPIANLLTFSLHSKPKKSKTVS